MKYTTTNTKIKHTINETKQSGNKRNKNIVPLQHYCKDLYDIENKVLIYNQLFHNLTDVDRH